MEQTERDARIAEIATLDQPVRRELYELLVQRDDWVSRDDAAERLGVPRSVAAFHLDKLAEARLVDVRFERPPGRSGPGAGRPAKKYRRAEHEIAVSLPDRRYDLAGALLAEAVSDAVASGRPADAALADAARRTGRELGGAIREEAATGRGRPQGGREARTRAARAGALRALVRLGYEPHELGGDIVLANCPFHALAERHRSLVCGMNLDLLSGLAEGLDAAERLSPRLEPAAGVCCVRLRRG
jgi:predicted ArsR family transcriptional regulator